MSGFPKAAAVSKFHQTLTSGFLKPSSVVTGNCGFWKPSNDSTSGFHNHLKQWEIILVTPAAFDKIWRISTYTSFLRGSFVQYPAV
jgi:hypothetical protein